MKRHALFVGVNKYDDKTIRDLKFSIPDASVLADRFMVLGYKTRLLPDPTVAELKKAVIEESEGLGRGDIFLFFFAGHGFTAQDGSHLLFCRDDIQRLLRVNDAGVRVNTLEALTSDGGFNRAFLLDSCRTDCFAGIEGRGNDTRDLDFVAVPECTGDSGSFFLLRSCDKFRPSMEFDSIGHGLFTQGFLDAMAAHDNRLAFCDTSFAEAIRVKMVDVQRTYNVTDPQRPSLGDCSGPFFSLFGDDFLSSDAPSPVGPMVQPLVICPVCGKKNDPRETFKCRECGRDNLCLRHQDEVTFLCAECATAQRRACEAAERKAEAERKAREAAEREKALRNGTCRETGICRTITLPSGAEMEMIYCAPGEFMMGSPESEEGRYGDEVLHRVTLTKGFWLGKYPVTQGQWQSVMGNNPSVFKGNARLPVENISWNDCKDFIDEVKSSVKQQLGGEAKFPTEAEWEYACRAGTTTVYFWGNALNGDKANCDGNYPCGTRKKGPYLEKTTPVGRYGANAWGFADMHGNVGEWCADWFGDYSGDAVDPTGPATGDFRVLRGGGWSYIARYCRSADRRGSYPGGRDLSYGFRLCCSAGP